MNNLKQQTEKNNGDCESIKDFPLAVSENDFEVKILKVIHKIYVDFVSAFRTCYWHKFEGSYKYNLHFLGRLHDSFDSLLDEGWENESRLEMIKEYIFVVQKELKASTMITIHQWRLYEKQIEDIASELFSEDREVCAIIEGLKSID